MTERKDTIPTASSDEKRLLRAILALFPPFLAAAIQWTAWPLVGPRLRSRIRNLIAGKRAVEVEARLATLVEQAPDGIFVADLEGRYTEVNSAGCRMLGYSREEIIGKAIVDLIPPEDVERLWRDKEQLLKGGIQVSEWMLRCKDGTSLPVEVSAKILADGRWQAFVRDIRERKRAEEALRLSEEQAKFLAEVGSVLASTLEYEDTLTNIAQLAVRDLADLCIVDIVGEDGEIRRLKVASRDPSNAPVCDLLMRIPLDRKRPHLVWSALETKRTVLIQHLSPEMVASLSQNEEHLWLLRGLDLKSIIAVPLLARGKLLGVIALVSATPSRVYGPADFRLAEELAQRAALSIENARLYRAARRAIQARDDVLGIVAHDLRNPLNSIALQAALLRRRGDEPKRRPAEVIERAATRMNRLIEDLLDVTRMEAGRLCIEQARIPAAQVVVDSVEAQKPLASAASLELRLEVAQDVPEVWADRDRLLQAFENLIGNAVKFTEPGGRIVVGAAPRDGEVLFWVMDTGAGIAPDDLPHVFDRFWQARKAGRRGAGLGLPIVKGIVEAHGGRIWVESTKGRGSTFFFTIPTVPPAEQWRPEPAPHNP